MEPKIASYAIKIRNQPGWEPTFLWNTPRFVKYFILPKFYDGYETDNRNR